MKIFFDTVQPVWDAVSKWDDDGYLFWGVVVIVIILVYVLIKLMGRLL